MSHRRTPNGGGTVITCDGEGCREFSITGQAFPRLHRFWLYQTQGWGRGQLRPTKHGAGTIGLDLCPICLARDVAAVWRRARARRPRRPRTRSEPEWRPSPITAIEEDWAIAPPYRP